MALLPSQLATSASLPMSPEDIEGTVTARFERVAEQFADHEALVGNGRRWTYRELNSRVNRVAHGLRAALGDEKRCVAILAEHSPEMVIAVLGAIKAGQVYLALHPQTPVEAQREIVRDAAPELILATRSQEAVAHEISEGLCPIRFLDDIGERFPDGNPQVNRGNRDPVMIFYTSGTTGRPKGVVKSHRTLLHRVSLAGRYDGITPSDRQSLLTACSFASSEADMFGALLHGATLCVFDVAAEGLSGLERWIDAERITVLHPPVLLFRRFLSTLEGTGRFPSVRTVLLAGEVVLPSDLQQWQTKFSPSCSVIHRFSSTETGLLAIARIGTNTPVTSRLDLTGFPVVGKELSLIDGDGHPTAPGETGELVVTSEFIADGYWRRGEVTAGAFRTDPDATHRRIYRTGDLGQFLPDGRFLFLGRRDHQVKVRGYRVELREIEAAVAQSAAVAETAVIARQLRDEAQLVAFVVSKPGRHISTDSLREELRTHLPEWKVPSRIEFVESLPTTLTGKVDRKRLEELIDTEESSAAPTAVGTAGEIAAIWREALQVASINEDDRFLELGGHSIAAMIVTSRIATQLGVTIPPATLLRNPSVRELRATVLTLQGDPHARSTTRDLGSNPRVPDR